MRVALRDGPVEIEGQGRKLHRSTTLSSRVHAEERTSEEQASVEVRTFAAARPFWVYPASAPCFRILSGGTGRANASRVVAQVQDSRALSAIRQIDSADTSHPDDADKSDPRGRRTDPDAWLRPASITFRAAGNCALQPRSPTNDYRRSRFHESKPDSQRPNAGSSVRRKSDA